MVLQVYLLRYALLFSFYIRCVYYIKMKRFFYILFFALLPTICGAQLDTMHVIDAIMVYPSSQKLKSLGMNVQEIDSAKLQIQSFNSLQSILKNYSHVFVKDYGANYLSTISVRGSNASQVSTMWNGFNLSMLSQSLIDYNLIPNFLIDKMNVQYGGNSAANSTGAIGATINLQSNLQFHRGEFLKLGYQLGSFSAKNKYGQYFYSNNKFVNSTKLVVNKAINNFDFYEKGSALFPKLKLENNQFQQIALLQENNYVIDRRHTIGSGIWWQQTNRQLPPTITSANKNETQIDNHTRAYLHLSGNYGLYQHEAHVAASSEYLQYNNPSLQLIDNYTTNRISLESSHQLNFAKLYINGTAQYNYGQMISKQYTDNPTQHRFAAQLAAAKKMFHQKINTIINIRQEMVNQQLLPFIYSVGTEYQINYHWQLTANINRVFRLPTFNDLFWAGAGNLNLLPEKGVAQEIGINYKVVKKYPHEVYILEVGNIASPGKANFGVHIFNRNINNWILWTPDNTSIWRPQNVLAVWSRGLEINATHQFTIKKCNVQYTVLYTYLKSTNEKVNAAMINALHQQLIYTPSHQASLNLDASYKQWQVIYNAQWVSNRFTSSDNNQALPWYTAANLQIRKNANWKKQSITIAAGINNIFNQNYQVIAFRPMPLRNYFLSFNFLLHRQTQKLKI